MADAAFADCLSQRCTRITDRAIRSQDADYVLCWLRQALRGFSNPVIDAALALGNARALPVVVFHGVEQNYPHASDRLHTFILEASVSLERDVERRGLRFIRFIEGSTPDLPSQLRRLTGRAAAVLTDDTSAFVAHRQSSAAARQLDCAVIVVDAARIVPELAIGSACDSTPAFRREVMAVMADWLDAPRDMSANQPRYSGLLPIEHDALGGPDAIARRIADCSIDHTLRAVAWCQGHRENALSQLAWACCDVVPDYAARRNNPALTGVTWLSPYLHFGVLGPDEVARLAREVESSRSVWKFLDELVTWREYFHHQACHLPAFDEYGSAPPRGRATLDAHADDKRESLPALDTLVHGETDDETWNAGQRQFLADGWMHNNLRMYWGKRLIGWTGSPELAWRTACYLNDRLSLDGRDPATYGNLRWVFGGGRPAREVPVYGTVARKSDAAVRRRPGAAAWLAKAANRQLPRVSVPSELPARELSVER